MDLNFRVCLCTLAVLVGPLLLNGCGTTTTTTTATTTSTTLTSTTTSSTTSLWTAFPGKKCANVVFECGQYNNMNLDQCQGKCENTTNCEGISWSSEEPCELMRSIDVRKCQNQTGTNVYVMQGRKLQAPNMTEWSTDVDEVVTKANKLYHAKDNGVLVHMIDHDSPWTNGLTSDHMSFCLVNQADWSGRQMIYRDGNLPSIIATPDSVQKLMKCIFPCDADSDGRALDGCGIGKTASNVCDGEDKVGNWCANQTLAPGRDNSMCAFKPQEVQIALEMQSQYKAGKHNDWYPRICTQHPAGASHNEAVVDGFLWNAVLPKGVWAFLMTSACEQAVTRCKNPTIQARDQFHTQYKKKLPIVRFNLELQDNPFSAFTQAFEQINLV